MRMFTFFKFRNKFFTGVGTLGKKAESSAFCFLNRLCKMSVSGRFTVSTSNET